MITKHLASFLSACIRTDSILIRNKGHYLCTSHSYCTTSNITAGILVIGDEILKGVTDVNTPFLVKQLNEMNVKIRKVAIVPDDINAIAEEVCVLSSKCSLVFTSGGIGPTHDDVTYEAIAKACNEELQLNEELFNFLINYFGPESKENPGIVKYAHLPKSAFLNYIEFIHNNRKIKYPIVSVKNIYVFPGVPVLLQKSFSMLKHKFVVNNPKNYTKDIFIDLDELSVIKVLNKSVKKFEKVKFGSYPTFSDNYYKIKLTLESHSQDEIDEVQKFLFKHLPHSSVVHIKRDILLAAKDYVYSLSQNSPQIFCAISVIEEAMKRYCSSELCICFNGGKDCTALLHILYACFQNLKPEEWNQVQFLNIKNGECFEEIEIFIESMVKLYNIKLATLEGDLNQTVSYYLQINKNVKAMFMGMRKSDPGASNLKHFSLTDSDWPPVIRILPILSWNYSDVWHFIRELQLPYCTLYDRGYSSLGVKCKTIQNPVLLLKNRKSFQSFKPAYMLQNSESERNSRL